MRPRPQFKRRSHEVGLDCGLVPGSNAELGVRGLGPDLKIRVPEGLANRVDADVVTSLQKIHIGKLSFSGGVELRPLAVAVPRQKFRGVLNVGLGARS